MPVCAKCNKKTYDGTRWNCSAVQKDFSGKYLCHSCYIEAEKELTDYNRSLDLQKLNQEREIRRQILSMKCPKCGGELEKGYLQAPSGLYWDVKEHDLTVLRSEELIAS